VLLPVAGARFFIHSGRWEIPILLAQSGQTQTTLSPPLSFLSILSLPVAPFSNSRPQILQVFMAYRNECSSELT